MGFYDGTFIPLNPQTGGSIGLDLLQAFAGGSNYIEFRGYYTGTETFDGSPPTTEGIASLAIAGQLNGELLLTHRATNLGSFTPLHWQIFQNQVDLTSFVLLGNSRPMIDLNGDFGVFVQPMPFTPDDDKFNFNLVEYPLHLLTRDTVFQFPPVFSSSGDGDDVVTLWSKTSTYAQYLTGFDGGLGNDRINGGNADDRVAGGAGDDTINGNAGADTVTGGDGVDDLRGGTGADDLQGGIGDDRLNGGRGKDRLIGDAGADAFVFDQSPGKANLDTITFFDSLDTFLLDRSVFGALGVGELKPGQFKIVGTGISGKVDANDRIIYDSDTGLVLYDPDGNPAGPGKGDPAAAFAVLVSSVEPVFDDFVVF